MEKEPVYYRTFTVGYIIPNVTKGEIKVHLECSPFHFFDGQSSPTYNDACQVATIELQRRYNDPNLKIDLHSFVLCSEVHKTADDTVVTLKGYS